MNDHDDSLFILVAEDDDDDYFLTEKAFRDCRFQGTVIRVKDGQELMEYLGKNRLEPGRAPRLLILDLNMPRKDGREALQEIKSDPTLRKLPVVVMTTSMNESDVAAVYDLGANAFIRKPENFELFTQFMGSLNKFWLEVAILPYDPSPQNVP